LYQYCFKQRGERGNAIFMSFALEPEIATLAWIDNDPMQFPLNIYATKGFSLKAIWICAGSKPIAKILHCPLR